MRGWIVIVLILFIAGCASQQPPAKNETKIENNTIEKPKPPDTKIEPVPQPPLQPKIEPPTIEPPSQPEKLTPETCEKAGGRWNVCGSACRGAPPGTICTEQCVAYCECGTWNNMKCPEGRSCEDLIPPQAGYATGICKKIEPLDIKKPEELENEVDEALKVSTVEGKLGVKKEKWTLEDGTRIAGKYADAEIALVYNQTGFLFYRMYYAIEPEVPGNQLEIFSSRSYDGLNWEKEDGIRLTFATFPDVVELNEGKYRMYFQRFSAEHGKQAIMSAISDNGLDFEPEEGARLVPGEGLDKDGVASTSVIQLADGKYRMYYRATINEVYDANAPNKVTSFILSAISNDGLTFTKESGTRIESRNDVLRGWVDGTFILQREDKKYELYFWSYNGVFKAESEDGLSFKLDETPVFTGFLNSNRPEPPGDPSVMKMKDGHRMYFGSHTRGIYSAFSPFEKPEEKITGLIFGNEKYVLLLNDIALDTSAAGGACALIEIVEIESEQSLQKGKVCKGTDFAWDSPEEKRFKIRLVDIAAGYSGEAKWANFLIFG